jgi:hypothetical protein
MLAVADLVATGVVIAHCRAFPYSDRLLLMMNLAVDRD